MHHAELDDLLAGIVLTQSSKEDWTRKLTRLLTPLREHSRGTIDLIYVLDGGRAYHKEVEGALGKDLTIRNYRPEHVFGDGTEAPGRQALTHVRGNPDPNHPLLIVDDAWNQGNYKRAAHAYFCAEGYERIWVLHTLGNAGRNSTLDQDAGYTIGNPVLCTAQRMLDYFDAVDKEYRKGLAGPDWSGVNTFRERYAWKARIRALSLSPSPS